MLITLGEDDIAERKAYLQFTEGDIADLTDLHARLEHQGSSFAEAFYNHLLSFPHLRDLIAEPDTLVRLKHTQSQYFNSLTAGEYGAEYVQNRLHIGAVHQRIGLAPKWYIGAYRKYISQLMPLITELYGDRPEKIIPAFDALFKIICFDMGLALEAYSEADKQEILRHKDYAEQVIALLPVGLIVVDADLTIRSVNPAMRELIGVDAGSTDRIDTAATLSELFPDKSLLEHAARVLDTGEAAYNLIISCGKCEGMRHFDFQMTRASLESGFFLLITAKDVTDRINTRAELRESEERFRLTFSMAGVGLAHLSIDGQLLRVNQKLCDILGYTQETVIGLNYHDLTHPDDVDTDQNFLRRILCNEIQSFAREKQFRHGDGFYFWGHNTVSLVRREDGTPRYFITVLEDISQRKKAAEQLIKLAKYDALTELPNRISLQERLLQAINLANRAKKQVAVLFLDLDRFKEINDCLGHDAGDIMLKQVSRRLLSQLRESDTVARLGGDEFVILLYDVEREEHVAKVANKILTALSESTIIKNVEFFPTASMGISIFPKDGTDIQTLLKNADTAMYRAKGASRNMFRFYSQEMNESLLHRLQIESGLRHAVENKEFVVHYQPIVDANSKAVIGVEALLRWQPPGKDLIPPGDFIAVAEDTGLITAIGEQVLRDACSLSRKWADAGIQGVSVTVNVSARQFQHDIVGVVASVIDDTGCDPGSLILELTETALMEYPEQAEEALKKLKQIGVKLAIDDFGTGYSSLSYLRRFPIDLLKIDKAFVASMTYNQNDLAIARAVIALAHAMYMDVIAEGVEAQEQADALKAEHCHLMQGFHFGRPMPVEQIESLLLQPSPYKL